MAPLKEVGAPGWLRCRPLFPFERIFPDLSNNDMLLCILKGINLPTPTGEEGHLKQGWPGLST